MNKYVLVTGGAGFVGSVLSIRLISEGYHVTICDDLSNGKQENIPAEAEFHKLDISDTNGFSSIPEYPYEIIFHVAAQASNALSWKDPIKDLMVNQLGTYNVLKFCKKRRLLN